MFHENGKWQHCETVVPLAHHQHPLVIAQQPNPLKVTAVGSLMDLVAASPSWRPCHQSEVFYFFFTFKITWTKTHYFWSLVANVHHITL